MSEGAVNAIDTKKGRLLAKTHIERLISASSEGGSKDGKHSVGTHGGSKDGKHAVGIHVGTDHPVQELLRQARWRLNDAKDSLMDAWSVARHLCAAAVEGGADAVASSVASNAEVALPRRCKGESYADLYRKNKQLAVKPIGVRYVIGCALASYLWDWCRAHKLTEVPFISPFWGRVAALRPIINKACWGVYYSGDELNSTLRLDLTVWAERDPSADTTAGSEAVDAALARLAAAGLPLRLDEQSDNGDGSIVWYGVRLKLGTVSVLPPNCAVAAAAKSQRDPTNTFYVATDGPQPLGY